MFRCVREARQGSRRSDHPEVVVRGMSRVAVNGIAGSEPPARVRVVDIVLRVFHTIGIVAQSMVLNRFLPVSILVGESDRA